MGEKVDFNRAASLMMFGVMLVEDVIKSERMFYRKNKDSEDLKKAFRKSFQRGNGKSEHESDWLELYLKDVFKLTKAVEDKEDKQ